MSRITITVPADPDKQTRVAVEGHAGPGCHDLTANLQRAMGQTTTSTETDEYYQAEQQSQQGLDLFGG